MSNYRGRFAPSPTGPLHFGSLVAALGSWLDARHHGGRWLIRVEDLDPPREVAGATASQLAALARFGMESDEPVLRQSSRSGAYEAALARLLKHGLAFECRCSRRDLEPSGGVHRACVARPHGRGAAIRLRVGAGTVGFDDRLQGRFEQSVADAVGDVVLRRSDGLYAYQLAVVVDDAAQGITDVVRGADLLDSTPRQLLLQRALALPTPHYLHLPLAVDRCGHKLSKSLAALPIDGADPLPALRAAWTFLQPTVAAPGTSGVSAFLREACARYRPQALPQERTLPAPGHGLATDAV